MSAQAFIQHSQSSRTTTGHLALVRDDDSCATVDLSLARQRARIAEDSLALLGECSIDSLPDALRDIASALAIVHLYEPSVRMRELSVMLRHPSCSNTLAPTIRARAIATITDQGLGALRMR